MNSPEWFGVALLLAASWAWIRHRRQGTRRSEDALMASAIGALGFLAGPTAMDHWVQAQALLGARGDLTYPENLAPVASVIVLAMAAGALSLSLTRKR